METMNNQSGSTEVKSGRYLFMRQNFTDDKHELHLHWHACKDG